MAVGIKDKVAIIGMGCTRFGERWDVGPAQLMQEAFEEALQDAGIEKNQIDAAWYGTCSDQFSVGNSAIPASNALRLNNIPVSRMENMCATGSEVLRAASYAVASGAVDIALAIGVEKLKDTGYGGLPAVYKGTLNDLWLPNASAPGGFAQLAAGYRTKYDISKADLKQAMAHVSWKSHKNGALNPKAHLRREVPIENILNAPLIADPLGLFDCCGVSDGCAAAIVTTPEIARSLGHSDVVSVKAIQLAISSGVESTVSDGYGKGWDGSHVATTRAAAKRAYEEAGITDPREELSMLEVHDCFSITELVTMEDLFVSKEGEAVTDILNGFYDADGSIPCQIDGGLKCFGHPVAASGLRMVYETYTQLLGRAGNRQINSPSFGLTHNLGGVPYQSVAAISILGLAST